MVWRAAVGGGVTPDRVASPAMRKIWLLAVVALTVAACATPKNENVSPVGPERSTTVKDRVTTTTRRAPTTTEGTTTTTAAPAPVEVARWSGSVDTDTENFTVDDSWEIHWNVTGNENGGAFFTWLVPGEAFPADSLSVDVGSGHSLVREGGTFYFEIKAIAVSYEVWVVDIPN